MKEDIDRLAEFGIAPQWIAERGLCRHPEAEELVLAEVGADGREHYLIPAAACAWQAMQQAAAADGIELFIVSAHRGVERQAAIVRRKLEAGEALADILQVCAPPGYSEHHSGRAIDIGTPEASSLNVEFETTPAFAWLMAQAGNYGFRLSYPAGNAQGYVYEPWHWCWHATP